MGNPDYRQYDKAFEAWLSEVTKLTGKTFRELEDEGLDPHGGFDAGLSPEQYSKEL